MRIQGLIFAGSATPEHAAMTTFVAEVLGLPRLHDAGSGAAMFGLPDGSRLAVTEEREPGKGTSRTIGLEVDDAVAAAAELAAAGADVGDVQANDDYRYVHVRAPDGRLWELVERIGPTAALEPTRRPGAVVVASVPDGVPDGLEVLASVHADEGICVLVDADDAARAGLRGGPPLAWITLRASGPRSAAATARALSALTAAGIAPYLLPGIAAEHLVVPVEQADAALNTLAGRAGS